MRLLLLLALFGAGVGRRPPTARPPPRAASLSTAPLAAARLAASAPRAPPAGGGCRGCRRCRSNTTHICWQDFGEDGGCRCQTLGRAASDAASYLRANLMPFDVPNAGTLGFRAGRGEEQSFGAVGAGKDSRSRGQKSPPSAAREEVRALSGEESVLPDGLSDGIVNRTIHLALATKSKDYPWTRSVPRSIFFEYVLSFANVNEARTNWRPLLTDVIAASLSPFLEKRDTEEDPRVEDVVLAINRHLWYALGRPVLGTNETQPIMFVGGQTPLVYDPMSIVAFGYASCTGVSILLVNALRAAGVPARLVGTPAWHGDKEKGNHNWVEVWTPTEDGGTWRFMEPSVPGGDGANVDNLERDPCDRWFCDRERLGKGSGTRVYAARLDRDASRGIVYPMAWDWNNEDVCGEERTDWYQEVCDNCP